MYTVYNATEDQHDTEDLGAIAEDDVIQLRPIQIQSM